MPEEWQRTGNHYMVPSVKAAVKILKYLKGNGHRRSSLTEICNGLDLSKSSAFSILKTLLSEDLVGYDEADKKYSLGLELLELGGVVADELDMIAIARPFAKELARRTEETCIIVRWVGGRFIVLHRQQPERDAWVNMGIGHYFEYVFGAFGKAYMAFASDEEVRQVLKEHPLRLSTPHTITDWKRFEKELEACRGQGYAEGYEEAVLGVNAVASPIFDRAGSLVLVIGILGFSSSLSPELVRLDGRLVRETAEQISAALGSPRRFGSAPRPADDQTMFESTEKAG